MEGVKLEEHYRETLATLGKQGGMLGLIFRKAQNKIQDPAKLRQLIVELIGKENWLLDDGRREGRRLRGPAGEERPGHEERGGAVLHAAPADRRRWSTASSPKPGEVICDPACGTGGFLLSAARVPGRSHYQLDKDQKKHLKYDALRGVELVDSVARLCAMNLFLHGIGPHDDEREPPIRTDDAPAQRAERPLRRGAHQSALRQEVVASPWSTRRARPTSRPRRYNRPDFWTTTSNKQLNFVQHVKIAAQDQRPRRRRRARQRALRGRGRARPSAASSCTSATSTPCCACPPASSTPRA